MPVQEGELTDNARWAHVVNRHAAADGSFVYSVATTGVYCRPSCPARTPNPKNVAFHETPGAAEAAGFRACKRCRPKGPSVADEHAALVAEVCRVIEASDVAMSLSELAQRTGLSESRFHRVFKAVTGVTPKAYGANRRATKLQEQLTKSPSVTDALYDAGFRSNGRFYENSDQMLGMTPTAWRAGGAGQIVHFAVAACSLGALLVAQSERGICAISLGSDPNALVRELQDRFPQATMIGDDPAFDRLVAKVVGLVESPKLGCDLPLDIQGTAFQRRVWQALQAIPVGKTVSYTEVAEAIGSPRSVRAVATACAANTLAIVIPCHRVVRTDGSLSGYRWGVERKQSLLEREGSR